MENGLDVRRIAGLLHLALHRSVPLPRTSPEPARSEAGGLRRLSAGSVPHRLARRVAHGRRACIKPRGRRDCGLAASQFVGHFLLHAFDSPGGARRPTSASTRPKRRSKAWGSFPECARPHGAASRRSAPKDPRASHPAGLRRPSRPARSTSSAACSISPSRPAAGWRSRSSPATPRRHRTGSCASATSSAAPSLGYNFDTGHAWSCKEWVPLIPAARGPTHPRHAPQGQFPERRRRSRPARAPSPGRRPCRALAAAGYAGSLDIEFRCRRRHGRSQEYGQALRYLQPLGASGAAAPATHREQENDMLKFAVITSFLGQTKDRFHEYNAPLSLEEKFGMITEIEGITGVESSIPTRSTTRPPPRRSPTSTGSPSRRSTSTSRPSRSSGRRPDLAGQGGARQGRALHQGGQGFRRDKSAPTRSPAARWRTATSSASRATTRSPGSAWSRPSARRPPTSRTSRCSSSSSRPRRAAPASSTTPRRRCC